MAYIASRPFFCFQIVVVLRNRGFKHRRAEIGSIAQVLRPGVIREESKPPHVAAANIDIASVIPALRCVFQKINRAHRKAD